MPAVIQRLITPEGAVFPVVEFAVRSLLLFSDLPEWSWSEDAETAYVFETHGEADVQARAFNCGAFAVIRSAASCDSKLQIADCKEPTTEGVALRGVEAPRGVSPAAMAAASIPERIAAAKRNRKVAQERKRSAEDFRKVYERVSPSEAYARLEERHLD